MSEKPLDRLNYFNGQRLEAADLKLEQQYHIRVRRWLNKSLYTTGIAQGLEVASDPAQSMNVIVSPGMALDSEGREIILLDQVSVPVVGTPSAMPGIVSGNYLTIQYNEQTTEEELDGCAIHTGKKGCKCGCGGGNGNGTSKLAWGGPAIVRAQPILGFTDYLPSDTSGKIVLAQVELDGNCKVVSAHPEVRRYVGAASSAKVYQYALEGQREVTSGDGVTAGSEDYTVIYFHIRGREPNAVTLYLRADTFPTLHYTEMGDHTHKLSETGNATTSPPTYYPIAGNPNKYKHQHSFGPLSTGDGVNVDGAHPFTHDIQARSVGFAGVSTGYVEFTGLGGPNRDDLLQHLWDPNDSTGFVAHIGGGSHSHTILASTTANVDPFTNDDHTHTVALASMANAGVTDPGFPTGPYSARAGAPLTYVNALQIYIDGILQTDNIITQLKDADTLGNDWSQLGDGTASHALVDPGTGPIKLDFLPQASFTEGQHTIEIHSTWLTDPNTGAPIPTGGRVFYNLYVE